MKLPQSQVNEITELLNKLLLKVEHGQIETHTLVYITNLLENAVIDAFEAGKISKETMDNIIYGGIENETSTIA